MVTQLFRRLFRHAHPACHVRRNLANLATALHHGRQHHQQLRALSSSPSSLSETTRGTVSTTEKERQWQHRSTLFPANKTEEVQRYPLVTAKELRNYKERPRRVKMLMRDFIEGMSALLWFILCAPLSSRGRTY